MSAALATPPPAVWTSCPRTVIPAVTSTSAAVPTISTRSTAFPRAIGRDWVTPMADSRPCLIALIIPVAAQANTARLTSPAALAGVAIAVSASSTSWRPATETGSASVIVLVDVVPDAVVLQHESEDRGEHDRQRHD